MASLQQNQRVQLLDALLFGAYMVLIILVSVFQVLPLHRWRYITLLIVLTLGRAGLYFLTDHPVLRRRILLGSLLSIFIIYLVYSRYTPTA